MIKAIFYKEWIKMRWFCLVAALFLAGFTAYALLRVQRVITFKGAAHIWGVMLEKEVVFIDILQYLPVLLGVLLALVQFIPEMTHKRLKLTLHLPFPQRKMILLMMGVGLAALAVLSAVQAFVLWCYFHTLLAPELVSRILLTSLPWYLAGWRSIRLRPGYASNRRGGGESLTSWSPWAYAASSSCRKPRRPTTACCHGCSRCCCAYCSSRCSRFTVSSRGVRIKTKITDL